VVALGIAVVATIAACWRERPALAHVLWALVLVKMATPPLFRVPIELARQVDVVPSGVVEVNIDGAIASVGEVNASTAIFAVARDSFVSELPLLWIWVVGAGIWFLLAAWRSWKFDRLLKFSTPVSDETRALIDVLATRMELRRRPEAILVEAALPPLLWSYSGRTTIVLPLSLMAELSLEEQEAIIAHELAHFRRRDHWFRWVEWMVLGVYWWHPLVWWARNGLRKAEEKSCDAWVVWTLPSSAKSYAGALMKTLDFLSDNNSRIPVTACGFGARRTFKNLKERFTMILKNKPSHRMTKTQKTFTTALAVLLLPVSGYLMQSQVLADEDAKRDLAKEDYDERPERLTMEARLLRLEEMIESLVAERRSSKSSPDRKAASISKIERQKLRVKRFEEQLELARREWKLDASQQEIKLEQTRREYERAKKQHELGRIGPEEFEKAKLAIRLMEIEAQKRHLQGQDQVHDMEANIRNERITLRDLHEERETDAF